MERPASAPGKYEAKALAMVSKFEERASLRNESRREAAIAMDARINAIKRIRKIAEAEQIFGEVDDETRCCIAGFFDGDGSFSFSLTKHPSFVLSVRLYQSFNSGVPPELQRVKEILHGGRLHLARQVTVRHRAEWHWIADDVRARVVASMVAGYGIVKNQQASLTLKFLEGSIEPKDAVLELAKLRDNTGGVVVDHKLTDPYLAGLFVAEGCVCVSNDSIQVSITQASIPFLDAIQRRLGGQINPRNGQWYCYGEVAASFLVRVRKFVFGQKSDQIVVALGLRDVLKVLPFRSDEKQEEKQKAKGELKEMKRR